MAISRFPHVDTADEDGILALYGDLDVESLLLAYRSGIFPWPLSAHLLAWFAPDPRAVLFFEDFHVPRSLRKELKLSPFTLSIDEDTPAVIEACAAARNRKGQQGTWITPAMTAAYIELHRAGNCHSIECWHGDKLVGGLYGVSIGGFFGGESMFHLESGASKHSFCFLVEHLRARGFRWLDCQMLTPLLESFGAREIPREEFMLLLKTALESPVSFA